MYIFEYSEEILNYLRDSLSDKVSKEDIDKLLDSYLHTLKPIYYSDNNKGLLLYNEEDYSIALCLYDDYDIFTKLMDELVESSKENSIAKITANIPKDIEKDYLSYGFSRSYKDDNDTSLELLTANNWLNKMVDVTIDHPYGSHHPYRDLQYELNYGYCYIKESDTYINAYVYGIKEPIESYEGIVVAVIYHKEDSGIRLVVASPLENIERDKLIQEIGFEEQYYDTYIYTRDSE